MLTLELRDGRQHGDEQAALRGRGVEERVTEAAGCSPGLIDAVDQVDSLGGLAIGSTRSASIPFGA